MKKICIVCGKEFECGRGTPGKHKKVKRRDNSTTCSKECSKIFYYKRNTKPYLK
jgi:hypothetical protein